MKAGNRGEKRARLAIMFQKQKGLVMNGKNSARIYMIETKIVILSSQGVMKKRGEK
jgi:hypothetical protein